MQFAKLVPCSIHGVLDHMTGGINAPFIKLKHRKRETKTDDLKMLDLQFLVKMHL